MWVSGRVAEYSVAKSTCYGQGDETSRVTEQQSVRQQQQRLFPAHGFEAKPARYALELAGKCAAGVGGYMVLEADPPYDQSSILPIGFEVSTSCEPVSKQERQDVIAVNALGRRRVDFDPVVEAEQSFRSRPLPDERIERCHKGTGVNAAGAARLAMAVGNLLPALDTGRQEDLLLDKLVERGPEGLGLEAKIITQIDGGGDSQRAGCPGDQLAMGFLLAGHRKAFYGFGNDPLGQIVDALKAAAPR